MAQILSSYQQAIAYADGRFTPVTLAETARAKSILACFAPGQFIPVHAPGVDLTLVILEGSGVVVAGEDEQPFQPGTIAWIGAGEVRGLKAETRAVALMVVTPPPTAADHAEMIAGLRRGSWRAE